MESSQDKWTILWCRYDLGRSSFDQAISGEAHTDISYDYLCVPDEILERSRIADTDLLDYWGEEQYYEPRALTYPKCTDNSLNYYVQKGVYFTSFDEAAVLQSITDQRLQGTNKVVLQFGTAEAMQQMITLASTENNAIFQALGDVGEYQYYYNDQTYTFELADWF